MRSLRQDIGGLGNILFKNAYLWAQMRDKKIPDIYVQSEKYFRPYRNEIRALYGNGIGQIDKIALHIRRGDYLKASQFHTNLWETDYYKEAISKVYSILDYQTDDSMTYPEKPKFLIFCKDTQNPELDKGDQEWCKANLPLLGIDFEMYEHGDEVADLNSMASCKIIIGANSSFSWWAAYLGNGKVIMPKEERWFTDKVVRTELLDEWIKV